MVKFIITFSTVLLTVALVIEAGSGSNTLPYRKCQVTDLQLVPGETVNVPVKGRKCKPIGELEVQSCKGMIEKTTFSELTEVKVVNIVSSEINLIRCDAFSSFKKLEAVILEQSTVNFAVETSISGRTPLKYFTELNCRNSNVTGLSRAAFHDLSYVKKLTIESTTLTKISADVFSDLISITELSITSTVAAELDLSIIAKLSTLQYLAIHQVETSYNIDYNKFQSLTNLQTIRFEASAYQKLDFSAFTNLKTVEIVQADAVKIDVTSMVQNLAGRGIECKFV